MNKVEVKQPWFTWRTEGGAETGCKFNRPTPNRKYIKILSICLTPASMAVIYPNVKNPVMHQVRDMCRAGLLDRLTNGKRYYYKTTVKGRDLISKAIR